jgi:hypothetical protein
MRFGQKKFYARIASFALLSNQRIVPRNPSCSEVFAFQPNSVSARSIQTAARLAVRLHGIPGRLALVANQGADLFEQIANAYLLA